MITSLTLKSKEVQNRLTRPDEGPAHKALLLLMVRLIHADPMLLLNVSIFHHKSARKQFIISLTY